MNMFVGLLCVAFHHLAAGDSRYGDVCKSPTYGGYGGWGSSDFELLAPAGQRIEAIHLCATKDEQFKDHVAGFQVLYTDGTMSETIGCNEREDIYDPIILSEDENITGVDIYHGTSNYGGDHVVQALTFHTTKTTYGPLGLTDKAQMEKVNGNKLIGLTGRSGVIIDRLSVIFESC